MTAERNGSMISGERLEWIVGVVLRAGVTISSVCLAAGLALELRGGPVAAAAVVLLQAGIVVLLATPVARVVVSIVQYANERDWTFVALTAFVLLELIASAAVALVFTPRV